MNVISFARTINRRKEAQMGAGRNGVYISSGVILLIVIVLVIVFLL